MKKFISLVQIKLSIGWNKIYLLDINIFNQLDENKIHQLDETKIHQFAEPINPYFDERNLHSLEATIKYQFDEKFLFINGIKTYPIICLNCNVFLL